MSGSQAHTVHSAEYQEFLESYVDSPVRDGNKVTILTNGDEIFPDMLSAIHSAEESIAFLTYVYWKGSVAVAIGDALAKKASEGLKVSVLMDAFGSSKIDFAIIRRMKKAGVDVRWFRPLRWYTLHKYNNRTHRKILVVDQKVGFLGGVGIAQEWTGDAQNKRHWRDTHFRVEGLAVQDLIDSFNDNWIEAKGKLLPNSVSYKKAPGKTTVQVTSSKPVRGHTHSDKLFRSVIQAATRDINITTAYFAPSKRFRDALLTASAAGVKITILTNGSNTNHVVVRKAGHRYYHDLLKGGIDIYEYQKTLLHAKIMTIDAAWATVGSINFDDRSFVLNDEIGMSFADTALVKSLDEQMAQDLADSKQITLDDWLSRSKLSKIGEFLSNLVRHQL